jgi:hypothetical protein
MGMLAEQHHLPVFKVGSSIAAWSGLVAVATATVHQQKCEKERENEVE